MLSEHIEEDLSRFSGIEQSIATIQGMLAVLIILVIGSGALNWFSGH